MSQRRRARGFTLLEVLVALAIVAMSVGALLGTVTSSASNVIYLKDKTLAEWVALNRLTEVRIDTNMPDPGKRTGNSVMAGMRWEWEEEVIELPVKGMLRIDVRAHATGEFVDDTRPAEKPTSQTLSKSTPSTSSSDKTAWTTTVTGVVSRSRSGRTTAIATPIVGNLSANNPGNPNGAPGNGGGTPNAPNVPGMPTNPGNGGLPNPPKPPPKSP
jgi:general secretion pathway protein I